MSVVQSPASESLSGAIEFFEQETRRLHLDNELSKLPSPCSASKKEDSFQAASAKVKASSEIERRMNSVKISFLRAVKGFVGKETNISLLERTLEILETRTNGGKLLFHRDHFHALKPDVIKETVSRRLESLKQRSLKQKFQAMQAEVYRREERRFTDNQVTKLKLELALVDYEGTGSFDGAQKVVTHDNVLDYDLAARADEVVTGDFQSFLQTKDKFLVKAKVHVKIEEWLEKADTAVSDARYITRDVLKHVENAIEVASRFKKFKKEETKEVDAKIEANINAHLETILTKLEELKAVDARSQEATRSAAPYGLGEASDAQAVLTAADQITNEHSCWDDAEKLEVRAYIHRYLSEEVEARRAAYEADSANELLRKRMQLANYVQDRVVEFDNRAERVLAKTEASHHLAGQPIRIFA